MAGQGMPARHLHLHLHSRLDPISHSGGGGKSCHSSVVAAFIGEAATRTMPALGAMDDDTVVTVSPRFLRLYGLRLQDYDYGV